MTIDCIPVDYVSNLIIAATAYTAGCEAGTLNVMHSTSSQQNPAVTSKIVNYILEICETNPSMKQVFQPHLTCVKNDFVYNSLCFLTQQLPIELLALSAKMPLIGSQKK